MSFGECLNADFSTIWLKTISKEVPLKYPMMLVPFEEDAGRVGDMGLGQIHGIWVGTDPKNF
jgi:hypothetical protein